MKPVKVKICCISSIAEAKLAYEAGAHAIGLVSHMPSGPGVIEEALIAEIASWAPADLKTFLLTSETASEAIIEQHRRCQTTTLQLVDTVRFDTYDHLRSHLDVDLVQVVHVLDETDITRAVERAPFVDALLLDSGNPNLSVKELGGTGRVHNWKISQEIVKLVDIPVFLAGGLNPENALDAVKQVRPFGLDVCSGLRTDGHLDSIKARAFFGRLSG